MQQTITVPLAPARPYPPAGLGRARLLYWLAFFFLCLSILGLTWDRAWHGTHTFENFYSPPHIFIYTTLATSAFFVAIIVFSPRARTLFGPGFRFPLFPFEVPAALFLLGGGFVVLGIAGILDDIWHTNFGLDETGWSTPHAMIGWGYLLVFFGFVACRLALRRYLPVRWYIAALFGALAIGFLGAPLLGPLIDNRTPETVRAIAILPILKREPPVQHTLRIYLQWNLARTNPLFVPLSAIWGGAVLAFVRGIDKRARFFLTLTFVISLLTLIADHANAHRLDALLPVSHDPATWLPLPFFPAALALVIMLKLGVPERWAWAGAGAIFGVLVFLVWGRTLLAGVLMLLTPLEMILGAMIGTAIYGIVSNPARRGVWTLLFIGVGMPFIVGMVDLSLRLATP